MRPSRPWILYSLLRIGVFALALAILMLVGVPAWIAAIVAAIVGACVSYLFFRRQREAVARSLWEYRHSEHADADADIEDDATEVRADVDRAADDRAADDRATDDPAADDRAAGDRVTGERVASEGQREAQPDAIDQRREAGQL